MGRYDSDPVEIPPPVPVAEMKKRVARLNITADSREEWYVYILDPVTATYYRSEPNYSYDTQAEAISAMVSAEYSVSFAQLGGPYFGPPAETEAVLAAARAEAEKLIPAGWTGTFDDYFGFKAVPAPREVLSR